MRLTAQLKARWDALAGRERRLAMLAAMVVAAALLWWLALAPALATLRAAEVAHRLLDAQLQQMRSLQAQATALQAQPKLAGDEAERTLDALLKQKLAATAQMVVVGERATVTLKGAGADALAQWLTQARINARAVPTEVKLVRSTASNPGSKGPNAGNTAWDGTLVLSLPAR